MDLNEFIVAALAMRDRYGSTAAMELPITVHVEALGALVEVKGFEFDGYRLRIKT